MDLNGTIEAALETVRPAADAKTLVTALDHSLGTIEGAADRLQQVVWSLLMNAVKFTPAGGRVEVSSQCGAGTAARRRRGYGSWHRCRGSSKRVRGVPAEDSSSPRTHADLGLGLVLVRRLVESHGGTVVAESVGKGQGATFTVALPRSASRLKAEAPEGEPAATDGSDRRHRLETAAR